MTKVFESAAAAAAEPAASFADRGPVLIFDGQVTRLYNYHPGDTTTVSSPDVLTADNGRFLFSGGGKSRFGIGPIQYFFAIADGSKTTSGGYQAGDIIGLSLSDQAYYGNVTQGRTWNIDIAVDPNHILPLDNGEHTFTGVNGTDQVLTSIPVTDRGISVSFAATTQTNTYKVQLQLAGGALLQEFTITGDGVISLDVGTATIARLLATTASAEDITVSWGQGDGSKTLGPEKLINATTDATGANWIALPSTQGSVARIINESGTQILYRPVGSTVAGVTLGNGASQSGLVLTANTNEYEIKRKDSSDTQATVMIGVQA